MNLLAIRARALATSAKSVRHVRTPEGAAHYGQPIGSVIVSDGPDLASVARTISDAVTVDHAAGRRRYTARRRAEKIPSIVPPREKGQPPAPMPKQPRGTKHLWSMESDYDGYEMVVDSRNTKFYVAQDDVGWAAWDSENNLVAEGNTKSAALKDLDEVIAPELKPGYRWATEADRKRLVIPPGWRDVQVHEDKKHYHQAQGYDYKGKGQDRYTAEFRAKQDAEKFVRMKALQKNIGKLDNHLKKNMGDDTSDCLMMMRMLGMRPDTGGGKNADVETFGATSLQARHVKVTDAGLVTLTFIPGKKRTPVVIKVKDKMLADMLRDRLKTRSRNDLLFGGVRASNVNGLLKELVGDKFKNKDLRTLRANAIALELISKKRGVPKSKTEFRKWRRDVAQGVSDALGNTPTVALGSYINPTVFQKWMSDPSWA